MRKSRATALCASCVCMRVYVCMCVCVCACVPVCVPVCVPPPPIRLLAHFMSFTGAQGVNWGGEGAGRWAPGFR